MKQARHSGRRKEEGQLGPPTEQLSRKLDPRNIDERARAQQELRECGSISLEAQLVVRSPIDIMKERRRKPLPCRLPKLFDIAGRSQARSVCVAARSTLPDASTATP